MKSKLGRKKPYEQDERPADSLKGLLDMQK
jgi:hypothetical protein